MSPSRTGQFAAALLLALSACGGESDAPPPVEYGPRRGKTEGTAPHGRDKPVLPPTRAGVADEKAAKHAFDAAMALERTDPAAAVSKYRAVQARHPDSSWARLAEERSIALERKHRDSIEAAVRALIGKAKALADKGKYTEALEALRDESDPRARAESIRIRNRARKEFNDAVRKGSAEHFEELRRRLTPDLAEMCEEAIQQLREVEEDRKAFEKEKEEIEKQKARLAKARDWWKKLSEGKYEDVLKGFDGEAGDRALIEAAAAFQKALEKGRAEAGKMHLLDKKRQPFIANPAEVYQADLHRDTIVALAYSALPADEPETYVKCAMWFWFSGDEKAAHREMATAAELGDVSRYEQAFREGWLRTAISK